MGTDHTPGYGTADAPDLIYLPEISFSIDKFLNDVKNVYKYKNKINIVVSQGIKEMVIACFLKKLPIMMSSDINRWVV